MEGKRGARGKSVKRPLSYAAYMLDGKNAAESVLKRLKLSGQHALSDQLEKEKQILVHILERSEHVNSSHVLLSSQL